MVAALHERVNLGSGWQEVLGEELKHPYMRELAEFVAEERKSGPVYPPEDLVFNAFLQTPFDKVKVVIVGQDPYHGPGQAHGLCFSVLPGVRIPPSLQNIYKEIREDLGLPIPSHGCLLSWAQQGVLLLNATLTVRQGQPKSHFGRGWERFTDAALAALLDRDVIFVLWGRSAKDKLQRVLERDGQRPARVLQAAHPSPLSAHYGFFGCRHFSKINQMLVEIGRDPINWEIS
jgi:uracil-DNA glycosylase